MKLPPAIKSIIIFRALQLGDMLCAIPAVRALRNAYPHARITLAGLPWEKTFADRFSSYFDDFMWFPGYPGLPEQALQPEDFTIFLANVQANEFDLAIQLQGNGSIINPMVELFGASITAGYYCKNDYAPNRDYFMEYPDKGSEIDRHLLLMEFLGIDSLGNELEFPITEQDITHYYQLNLPAESKKYVCIHPGSRGEWRQWPTSYFALIADYCASRGLTVIVTGTQTEAEIIKSVTDQMKWPAIDLAGRTTLGAMGVLIKNAALLISNCTGVSHMAAAFETPSVVISMDGEPERWGPVNKRLHRTIDWLTRPDFDYVFAETISIIDGILIK